MKKLRATICLLGLVTAICLQANPVQATVQNKHDQTTNDPGQTSIHRMTRDMVVGPATVRLTVYVELYSNGSFHQINRIHSQHLDLLSSPSPTSSIDSHVVNVWSPTEFPTTELKYAYGATIFTELPFPNRKIRQELDHAHFQQIDLRTYQRNVSQNGSIRLYSR